MARLGVRITVTSSQRSRGKGVDEGCALRRRTTCPCSGLVDFWGYSFHGLVMRTRWVTLGALGLAYGCGGEGRSPSVVEVLDGGESSTSTAGPATGWDSDVSERRESEAGATSEASESEAGEGSEVSESEAGETSEASESESSSSAQSASSIPTNESHEENTSVVAPSGATGDATEGAGTESRSGSEARASTEASVTSLPTGSSDGGQSSLGSSAASPSEACSVECEPSSVRCVEGEQGLRVEWCAAGDAGACSMWMPVEGCESGICLAELVNDSCDPAGDGARCDAGTLNVCAPGVSGCPVWQDPTDAMLMDADWDIDEGATGFTGYGVLALKLTVNANENELVACLRDPRDVATESDSPAVESVAARGEGQYALQLSRYHLPVAYELAVAVGSPPVVRTTILAPDVKSRVTFVSKTKGNGDLANWTAQEDTPLEAADAVCQADAEAAGLAGTFRAYLSIRNQTDAICRLRGGEGLVDEGCGLDQPISEEQFTAPFLDMKGLPVAYGTKDIEQGLWRLPVGYAVDGTRANEGVQVWTGSTRSGIFGPRDCQAWDNGDPSERGTASASPGTDTLSDSLSTTCNKLGALSCFSSEVGHNLTHEHERPGLLAALVELPGNDDLDVASVDDACRLALGSSRAVAWFSDVDDDAWCRMAGVSGRVVFNCGQAVLPDVVGPWVRPDGYVVSEKLSQLALSLSAPVILDVTGAYVAPGAIAEVVRTDTVQGGIRGLIGPVTECINGERHSIGGGWTYTSDGCLVGQEHRTFVYCFDR